MSTQHIVSVGLSSLRGKLWKPLSPREGQRLPCRLAGAGRKGREGQCPGQTRGGACPLLRQGTVAHRGPAPSRSEPGAGLPARSTPSPRSQRGGPAGPRTSRPAFPPPCLPPVVGVPPVVVLGSDGPVAQTGRRLFMLAGLPLGFHASLGDREATRRHRVWVTGSPRLCSSSA